MCKGTGNNAYSQGEYEQAVAALRAALGEGAFAAAWAAGCALPPEVVIAYALETG